MTKTKTTKKVVQIKNEILETPEVKKEKKSQYHVLLKLNDKTYEVDTNDIGATILEYKPAVLKTSLIIKVTKGDKTLDRKLYLKDARRLFNNKITLMVFVRNLFF